LWSSSPLLALAAALILGGCSGLLLTGNDGRTVVEGPTPLPPGIVRLRGTTPSSTGCDLDYRLYRPEQADSHDLVVLGHGFLRSQEHMTDLAVALAGDGVPVVTLDFCNMRPWNGRHVQNAQDMIRVARALDAERIVYAGFSAGALAALVAGRSDPKAIGIVTLDLVDAQGIGRRAATGLDKPLFGLVGEPTNCNARDNARGVFALSDTARLRRIAGAGHCDFESPTDRLCRLLCEDPDGTAPSQRPSIIATTKTAVKEMLASG
jgi:pimeloyl-ACP methyl ester carboxylesterase